MKTKSTNPLVKTSFQVTRKQLFFLEHKAKKEQRSIAGILRLIVDDYISRSEQMEKLEAEHSAPIA